MDIGHEHLHKVLHERTWKYNELFWKNLVAFGAALVWGMGYEGRPDMSEKTLHTIKTATSCILYCSSLVQITLLRGLRNSIKRMVLTEKACNVEITSMPSPGGVTGTYGLTTLLMCVAAIYLSYDSVASFSKLAANIIGVILVLMVLILCEYNPLEHAIKKFKKLHLGV